MGVRRGGGIPTLRVCGVASLELLDLTGVGDAPKWLWELNEDTDRPAALSIIATLGRLSFVVVVFRLMPLPSPLATEPGRYGHARGAWVREIRLWDPRHQLHRLARLWAGARHPPPRRQRGPDGERPWREPAGIPAAPAAGLRPVPPAERRVAAHQRGRPGAPEPGSRAAGAGNPAAPAVPASRHHGDGPGDRGFCAHVAAR